MKLYEILIPAYDNKGLKFSREIQSEFLKEIALLIGGYTIDSNSVESIRGGWISPDGDHFSDILSPIRVACTERQLKQICELAATTFDQQSIMAYEVSPNVTFYKKA